MSVQPYQRFQSQASDLSDEPAMPPATPPSLLQQVATNIEPYASTAVTIYSTMKSVLGLGLSAAVITLDNNAACRIHPIIWTREPMAFVVSTAIGLFAMKSVLDENTPLTTKIRHLALGASSLTYSATMLFLNSYTSGCR